MNEYYYEITHENFDGTSWSLKFKNVIKYSKEEFQFISEKAIVSAFEKEFKREGYVFDDTIDKNDVLKFIESEGFSSINNEIISYCFAPDYHNFKAKNSDLIEWLDRNNANDVPKYLKDKNEQTSN